MKLSEYARKMGVTYRTAFRWWQNGNLDAYQMPSGTIFVRDPTPEPLAAPSKVALYARVSSADQRQDLQRQLQRLRDFAAAKAYPVTAEIVEVASGLNDKRPKLSKLLADPTITVILVEHRDRLTRFGFNYIDLLLSTQGRRLEVIFPTDTDNELVDDFVALITSMSARIYGRRNSQKRAEQIKKCVEQVNLLPDQESEEDDGSD